MKRIVSIALAVCMIFSFTIFASAKTPETAEPMTTGLITKYACSISKETDNYINIYGTTFGINSVVKTGFIDIEVQRRSSSSAAWGHYMDLDDYTSDNTAALYDRNLALPQKYQYRIYWKHYAKKSLLSTEKIKNYSNAIQM